MTPNIHTILVCPLCKGPLSVKNNGYRCNNCGQDYPVIDGLPCLSVDTIDEFKAMQKRVYEENITLTTPLQIAIDREGFIYPTTLKLARIGRIMKSLNLFPNARVLDIGCGDGRILNKLVAQYRVRGFGADISSNQLRENLKNNPFGHSYYHADAEKLPFQDNTFDFVICLDVLEHLSSPRECISEICRTLKQGGKALVYAISKKDRYTWHWFLRKISGGRLGVDRGHFGDHQRERFLYPEEVKTYFQESQAGIKRIIYFHSFFTIAFDESYRFLSTPYKSSVISQYNRQLNQESGREINIRVPFSVKLWSFLVKSLLGLLGLCDYMWSRKGYSNGFFIEISKQRQRTDKK